MKEYNSIDQVVNSDLCTGCGTCVAFCTKDAIFMALDRNKGVYIPKINPDLCNGCNTCLSVCPGYSVDFKSLNDSFFGMQPENYLIGNYQESYVGYSNEHDIRYNSSSGGLITQLLISALEEGLIDGVLVTTMMNSSPLEPLPHIARTKEEIINSMGSKYCPVPLNTKLKEILNTPDGEKFAVVGLPCHIHGIKKAEQINKKIRNKISFTIGIICSKCPSFLATEYLLKNNKISVLDIKQISYRGKGYPGGMTIYFKNGTEKFYSYWDYYDTCFGQFFSPYRCRLCIDFSSEFSDLSCGDVFFDDEQKKDSIGASIIISRNSIGEQLLKKAESKITIKPIEISKFIAGCNRNISLKKGDISQRGKILAKDVPFYNSDFYLRLNVYNIIFLYIYVIGNYLASHKKLWFILRYYGNLIGLSNKIYEKMNR